MFKLLIFAVKDRLLSAATDDNSERFRDALQEACRFNIGFYDVLEFSVLFHRYMSVRNVVVEVPHECIGYLLCGCKLRKLRHNVTAEFFSNLVASLLSTNEVVYGVDTLLPAVYGFRRASDLYSVCEAAWRNRPSDFSYVIDDVVIVDFMF